MTYSKTELTHFGVKGMKWGIRRLAGGVEPGSYDDRRIGITSKADEQVANARTESAYNAALKNRDRILRENPSISRKVDKQARKDAEEQARAKAYFGEGAGTRRKLINQTIEGRRKQDPYGYGKAVDHYRSQQNSAEHVAKAKGERKRQDVKNTAAKTARGISHMIRGNTQYASAAAAGIFAAGVAVHKAGIDKMVVNAGKKTYRNIKETVRPTMRAGMPASEFLKNMGL